MKLYIAEKPSLARAIAEVLPKPHKKADGFIQSANGDIVSWCIGHLLEQAEPDRYDARFKRWQLDHLPIIPDEWEMQIKKSTRKQFGILKRLIQKATSIIHAGDPDREGQLLVDEVIAYVGKASKKRLPVQRLLINDLNAGAIRKSFANMRENSEFMPLSASALARSRADWLYGINMTRLCTIKGKQSGYKGVLSVGRVQTPLLGMVVRRDETIAHFKPTPFFEVNARLETQDKQRFIAKWQPSEACEPYMDEENRVLSKALCENVIKRISGQPAKVLKASQQDKKQAPPLPYNLSSLQIDANRRWGLSAKQVLDGCQQLYEKYRMISYPRSDCRYLPEEHRQEAPDIVQCIAQNTNTLKKAVCDARMDLKSKAWNDKKVGAHHGIIPTNRSISSPLPKVESQLYQLIARQYLSQFYPPYCYRQQQLTVTISGGMFIAHAKQSLDPGWKKLFNDPDYGGKASKSADVEETILPSLKPGDDLYCINGELLEKQTQPPAYFTEATLLAAMTGISRHVKNPDIKKILKETDGLGTEATRAHIIELLFKRQFIKRQGKQVRATDIGKALIQQLPDIATQPDMTAQWESELERISQKACSYRDFMQPLAKTLNDIIAQLKTGQFMANHDSA